MRGLVRRRSDQGDAYRMHPFFIDKLNLQFNNLIKNKIKYNKINLNIDEFNKERIMVLKGKF